MNTQAQSNSLPNFDEVLFLPFRGKMTSSSSKVDDKPGEKDNTSHGKKHEVQNESVFSSIRRQWRAFTEYDLEPRPPPTDSEDTAWSRVKAIFYVNRTFMGTQMSPELSEIKTVVISGLVLGGLLGGRYGSKIHTAAYIRDNKVTQYNHVRQAERQLHAHAILGFGKYALRWGWRVALFAGIYDTIFNVVSAARNKRDGLSILAAGTSTGFIYKMFQGWREIVVGVVIGTALTIPAALLMQGVCMILPEEVNALARQQRKEQQSSIYQEWQQRLGKTDSTIGMISEDMLCANTDDQEEEEESQVFTQEKSEMSAEESD